MPKVTVRLPNRPPLVAGGSSCLPCEARRLQAQQETLAADGADETDRSWSGVIVTEGRETGDGRLMSPNSLRWDTLPMPLRWDVEDDGAHAGAVVVGLIESLERKPNGDIWATGYIDGGSALGREVIRKMDKGLLGGVSVDLDDMDLEVRVRAEALGLNPDGTIPGLAEAIEAEDDDEEPSEPEEIDPDEPVAEVDEDGRVKVYEGGADDELMVVLDARIRAATLVDIPAFEGARLTLDGSAPVAEEPEDDDTAVGSDGEIDADAELEALVAAAIPQAPPAAWFANPGLSAPTAITITDEGRVYGHLALWDTCHIGYSQCVSPPRSRTNYALFLLGETVTAEGAHIPTGRLTFDTRHAGQRASVAETMAHYDHTGVGGADLAVGEDEHGIWVAGALRPEVTPAQVKKLRAAPLSGDWRDRSGNLELVGILAVNIPGFPVPRRPRALVASGAVRSLVLPCPTNLPTRAEPVAGPSPALRRLTILRRLTKGNS
jgi:hypothetical protein